ncbi:hypothetical protein N7528_001990 [Penicillium herquei]|nr:hypothetical protein N7528_001990 [Penicillium herquei]
MSSSNQDPPASGQENPSTSAKAEDISEVTQVTSPSRSRSASLSPGPSSPTARSPSPGPSSPTPGPSRRNLTNEEFLINCFKAFDMKRQKVAHIDYDKLAALCNVTPKSAGNRWVSLRNKHGLKIKGFYKNQKPSADDDAA